MPRAARSADLEQGAIARGRAGQDLLIAIRLLARGRHQVEDLAAALGLGRRSAYRLLSSLAALGLTVERQKEGRDVFLRLRRSELEEWMFARPIPRVRS